MASAVGEGGQPLSEGLLRGLDESRQALAAAASALQRAQAARLRIRQSELIAPLARGLGEVDRCLPSLVGLAGAVQALPELLGEAGPRTYLLVAQNSDELRATGGAVVAIGSLTIERGRVTALEFDDGRVWESQAIAQERVPEPLRRYLGADRWSLREANWWPDLAAWAEIMLDLYASSRGVEPSGLVAVDLQGAAAIIGALGPLQVAGCGDAMDEASALAGLRECWAPPKDTGGPPGLAVTPRKPFRALEVRAYYERQRGAAWFDDLALADAQGQNLLRNPSFEQDGDGDGLPDGWQGVELAQGDGCDGAHAHSGGQGALLRGDERASKALVQRLERLGQGGETFYLAGWGWVEEPGDGTYGLAVTVEHTDGTQTHYSLNLPRREGEWADGAAWARLGEWWLERADLVGALAQALVARLQDRPDAPTLIELGHALKAALDERHLQLYVAHPAVRAWLAWQGWDGAMPPGEGDLLAVVDTNVGRNKVNLHTSSHIAYRVTLAADGGGLAELTLTYRNASPAVAGPCQAILPYASTYAQAAVGCYRDYVRVYAPPGSRLIAVSGAEQVWEPAREGDQAVGGACFALAPGQSRSLRFVYQLPAGLVRPGGPYVLWARKQAGTDAVPVSIEVLPVGEEPVRLQTDLRVDRRLSVVLR